MDAPGDTWKWEAWPPWWETVASCVAAREGLISTQRYSRPLYSSGAVYLTWLQMSCASLPGTRLPPTHATLATLNDLYKMYISPSDG